MKHNIRMSKTWIIIIFICSILFILGLLLSNLFLEALGVLGLSGALLSSLSEIIIRIIRRKRGKRFK
ncbi:hypothetical protein LGFR6_14970 [Lactococcus garvieae]